MVGVNGSSSRSNSSYASSCDEMGVGDAMMAVDNCVYVNGIHDHH